VQLRCIYIIITKRTIKQTILH